MDERFCQSTTHDDDEGGWMLLFKLFWCEMAYLLIRQFALQPGMAKAYILSFLIHCYKYNQQQQKRKGKKREWNSKLLCIICQPLLRLRFCYFLPKMPQNPLPLPDDFSVRAANDSSGYLTKLAAKSK